jgi:hypothetical protein
MGVKQNGVKRFEERRAGPFVVRPANGRTVKGARSFLVVRECSLSYGGHQGSRVVRRVRGYEHAMNVARALFDIEREVRAQDAGHDKIYEVVLSEKDSCASLYSTILRRWRLQDDITRAVARIHGRVGDATHSAQ